MTLNPPTHSLSAHGAGWEPPVGPAHPLHDFLRDLAAEDAAGTRNLNNLNSDALLAVLARRCDDIDYNARRWAYDIFYPQALDDDDLWDAVTVARRALLVSDCRLAKAGLRIQPPDTHGPYGLASDVATEDVAQLIERDNTYGSSWLRRGGTGAFMVGIRKWDRITVHLNNCKAVDLVGAVAADHARPDGVYDDLKDLRRYLYLWEAERQRRIAYPSSAIKLPAGELRVGGQVVGYLSEPLTLSVLGERVLLQRVRGSSAVAAPPPESTSGSE